jgi:hypothetical protein
MLNLHKYRPVIIFQTSGTVLYVCPTIKHYSNVAVALVWLLKTFLADESSPWLPIRIHYIQIRIRILYTATMMFLHLLQVTYDGNVTLLTQAIYLSKCTIGTVQPPSCLHCFKEKFSRDEFVFLISVQYILYLR